MIATNGSLANTSTVCPYVWEVGDRNISATCCSAKDSGNDTTATVLACKDDPLWWEKRRIALDIFRFFATLFAAMYFFPIPSINLNITAKIAVTPLVILDVIKFMVMAFIQWKKTEKLIKSLKYYLTFYVLITGFPIGFIVKILVASHYDDPESVPLFALFLPHGILFCILPLVALVFFLKNIDFSYFYILPTLGMLILIALWALSMVEIIYYVWPQSLPYIIGLEYLVPCTLSLALAPLWLLLLCSLVVTHCYFFSSINRGGSAKSAALHLMPDLLHLYGICCTAVILTVHYDNHLVSAPGIDQYMKPFLSLLLADLVGITGILVMLCRHCCSVCDYQLACKRFKESLGIDDSYFNLGVEDKCYCETCHKARGDKDSYSRGVPEKTYAMPVGWARFGLSLTPNFMDSELNVFENWHRAYHGTDPDMVKKILQNSSQLLMPGDVTLGGRKIRERDGHFTPTRKPEGFDTVQLFVTPSIVYAGLDAYATPKEFKDGGKMYKARVAFQLCIRPDSYEIGPETVGARRRGETIDPLFSNDELEWSTKERGGTALYGLLVKLEPFVDGSSDIDVDERSDEIVRLGTTFDLFYLTHALDDDEDPRDFLA
ncbi:PREDICTED: uncharacterized protein LOC109467393 [Branchiostoma belcheri]|uniref:Uncharacterized protein LOC109467393 n=1 Tax=Branchiostoma belcheri TaxID=7741 RepID=A0A6P4XW55_BRABE|nr:PREDICTED: uncharacterized protein LOC109467393 [Branchiostoma belcheri]